MNPPAKNPPEPSEPVPPKATDAKAPTPLNIASAQPIDPSKLTPEEQMALYEKDLKETDWGHQPC